MTTPLLLLQPANLPKSPETPDVWMPLDASVTAADIDWLYMLMVWLSVVFAAGIFAAMVYFVWKYKAPHRRKNTHAEPSSDHNTTLEITWSIIPLFIVIALFVWGFKGFVNLRTPPKGAMEIQVTGQKWKWLFEYPHGAEDALHVPVDRPVRVVLHSVDVLHSLFIPNFRVKMDAVPGRYTDLWFQATKVGEFPIFCAEYCGTSHSDMITRVVVHEPGGYEKWLDEMKRKSEDMPLPELGKLVYEKQGCAVCHSIDGTPRIGPTWKGLFGKQESFVDGSSLTADENYLRESITDPTAKVVVNYPPSMPLTKLSDRQITGVIEYIKTLK
ncbi:MAG TPA: cytochrome c oxidase subunit II [Polyangiaceae bacterium]